MTPAQLKSASRDLIRVNTPKIFIVGLVYIIITTFISELQFRLPAPITIYEQLRLGYITIDQFSESIRTSGLILSLSLGIMLPSVSIGFKSYCLKLTRKLDGDYKDLLTGFSMFLKVISLSITTTVLVMFWTMIFVFPGIIAYYKYRQAYYILLDDPAKSVMHCIHESKRLMNGKKMELLLVDLSFLGWYVLNIIVLSFIIPIFPVFSIWITPYYGLTQAAFYNNLLKEVTV